MRVESLGFRVQGLGFRVEGVEPPRGHFGAPRALDLVKGFGFRVEG